MNRSSNVIALPSARPDLEQSYSATDVEIAQAISRAQENLLRQQQPDGHWCGELLVDSTLCSDYVLFMHWCGEVDAQLQQRCVRHIVKRQLLDGGWNIFHGGPSEINASVKAYFALKLAGYSTDAPFMQEARANIMRLGGIPQMNTFSKLYLALLGQFPWKYLPTIPVEMVLLPRWAPFHICKMSSWSRAMLIPLSIINHFKPTRVLPGEKQLHELYPLGTEQSDLRLPRSEPFWTWRNFFLRVDDVLKFLHPLRFRPMRGRALEEAEQWMLQRIGEGSDGLAAVFPAMLNSLIALRALGYSKKNPIYAKAEKDFTGLFVNDPEDFRIQPCLSPVWDTAINIIALAESGVPPEHAALQKAADWLLKKEVRIRGDWTVNNPHPEASGWAFEYNNVYYPDTDDTAMVLMALRLIRPQDRQSLDELFRRAIGWQLSFQCVDGGWAAFDKNVTTPWLEDMPFADHNAILDPTCSDLTARTLELFGYIDFDPSHPSVGHALQYLTETQEDDGSWYGRWGVNYIYGTWQVLRGLRAIGQDMTQDWI
ncbi:MAG TPA: squalene--hopene cyclase, partial [Candidatus Dormibacteraeota bacterium]|nr:squalene--hopene cyclase [Candidatus Dormibacteraeota bacterium]